jgi:ABC-type dipeptide/oligopeptide/nickel transport system permease subunit
MLDKDDQIIKKESTSKRVKDKLLWIIKNPKFFLFLTELDDSLIPNENIPLINKQNSIIKRMYRSPLFIIGGILIFFILTITIFEFWLVSYENTLPHLSLYFSPPSPEHPFGTTIAGIDVLARMIYGARYYVIVISISTLISVFIGLIIGSYAAYYGGWLDIIMMRIMDMILSFPGVVFAIIFVLIWGNTIEYIILAYTIIEIPHFSRIFRTSILKEKNLFYVKAAKVNGAKNRRILLRHIMPNCIQPALASASLNMSKVLLSLAVLSFLGFGDSRWIQWGTDITQAMYMVLSAPWATFGPLLMIIITVMAFLLFGDGLRDVYALKPEYT